MERGRRGGERCRLLVGRKPASAAQPESARHEHGLPALKPLRVLVAGEVIIDRYIWGDVSRISPEAPIPILRVQRREEKPGNAGFVMANLRALGADVSALSVVGSDRNGSLLREIFADLGIDTRAILIDPDRPTIVKDRMLGSVQAAHRATQQLLRCAACTQPSIRSLTIVGRSGSIRIARGSIP